MSNKSELSNLVAAYATDAKCTALVVVASFSDGSSRFHVSPFPDDLSKACLAIGVCGAGGVVAGAKMDSPSPRDH